MKRLWILALLFAACGGSEEFDYVTAHGVSVILGAENAPSIEAVETWTDETLAFWWDADSSMIDCSISAVDGTRAKFVDALYLVFDDMKAWGFAYPWYKYIEVAGLGTPYVKSVYMHELSHIIVYDCKGLDGNDDSHAFFKSHNTPF